MPPLEEVELDHDTADGNTEESPREVMEGEESDLKNEKSADEEQGSEPDEDASTLQDDLTDQN